MKQEINGKTYDTENAIIKGMYCAGNISNDDWVEEELFETLDDHIHFLLLRCGKKSKYARIRNNEPECTEIIIILPVDMVAQWYSTRKSGRVH